MVVTDHGHFVLINVYVPNAGGKPERPRLATKLDFLRLLKAKADGFLEQGREVSIQWVGAYLMPVSYACSRTTLTACYEAVRQLHLLMYTTSQELFALV